VDYQNKITGGLNMAQLSIKMEDKDIEALKSAAEEQYITPSAMARAILLRTLREPRVEKLHA
jgi:hypothetical protein